MQSVMPGVRVELSREWRWQALLAMLAIVCVVLAIGPFPVGVLQDDGIYTVLAKSLAGGGGFRYLNLPHAPAATHFPPAYPLFLATLWKVFPSFPENVAVFKFANAILIGVAAVGAYAFARRAVGLSRWTSFLTVGAFTACAPVVMLSVMVMSEPMFLAVLFPVLLLCHRAAEDGSPRSAILAGGSAGLLALVRTLGIVAIPATAAVLLWRRRWFSVVLVCVSGALVMLPWQLWVAANDGALSPLLLGKYGSYSSWLLDGVRDGGLRWVAELAWFNTRLFVGGGWEMLSVDAFPVPVRFLATMVATAFFAGGLWLMMKRAPVAALMVAGYMLLVMVWPFPPKRFTFGIWPLLGLHFGLSFAHVWQSRPHIVWRRGLRYSASACAVLLCVGYAVNNYRSARHSWWTQVQGEVAERSQAAAEWVAANTPSDAVISTEDDVMIHLYTGRVAVPIGSFTPQEHMLPQTAEFSVGSLRSIVRTFDVDYVLPTTMWGARAAQGLVTGNAPDLALAGALRLGAVYEVLHRSGEP